MHASDYCLPHGEPLGCTFKVCITDLVCISSNCKYKLKFASYNHKKVICTCTFYFWSIITQKHSDLNCSPAEQKFISTLHQQWQIAMKSAPWETTTIFQELLPLFQEEQPIKHHTGYMLTALHSVQNVNTKTFQIYSE